MWVQSLGWKDTLEEGMIAHSSMPAWRIPGRRSLTSYGSNSLKELDMTD